MKVLNASGTTRLLPALRLRVAAGAVIDVPAELAEQLLAQRTNWVSAKSASAPEPVADSPAEEEQA